MTIPVWVLLAFAVWTIVSMLGTVGVYRWSRIFTGRAAIQTLRHDALDGHPDWYRRAMRAHGNCVETLPVYGAIVVAIVASGLESATLDALAIVLIAARVVQTLMHVSLTETAATVSVRSLMFAIQVFVMLAMSAMIVLAFARLGAST